MKLDTDTYIGILQATNAWNLVIDTQVWDDFDKVFTEDAILDISAVRAHRDPADADKPVVAGSAGLPVARGLDEIKELMKRFVNGAVHYACNLVLTGEKDGGVEAFSRNMALNPTGLWSQTAFYDLAVETDSGWRIKHRVSQPEFRMVFQSFAIE